MDNTNSLLPVPANAQYTEENKFKVKRKMPKGSFVLLFGVYLVSTLLGVALVPGRLELDELSFSMSVAQNGASFLCVERCFFALFLVFFGFTALRIPFSFIFVLFNGVYSGICIRLLLYNGSPFVSFALSLLFSFQLICDVFLSYLPFTPFSSFKHKRKYKNLTIYLSFFIVYFFVTYSLSSLIPLMLK